MRPTTPLARDIRAALLMIDKSYQVVAWRLSPSQRKLEADIARAERILREYRRRNYGQRKMLP
jgi:hypothetical protein